MYDSENDALIFIHIPKTAGSTFHMIMNVRYPVSETQNLFGARYTDIEIAQFIEKPNKEKEMIRLLKGHMPYGMHGYIPRKSSYISVLRDPVERVISQYYYIKKNTANPLHDKVEKGGMTINDFVSSGIAIGMNNGQCRFLNGDIDEYPFDSCDQSLLDNVKRHIKEQFIWLGITERFDESILLLSRLLAWEKRPHYIRENVSKVRKRKSQVEQKDIDAIKYFNKFDIQLYQMANEQLDAQIGNFDNFAQDLSEFKSRNAIIQRRWSWLPDNIKRFFI